MKKFKILIACLTATMLMTSCNDEPEASKVFRRVISFENTDIVVAGPTSYGENLYATYTGKRFTTGSINLEEGVDFQFGINADPTTGEYNFWNGGMVLSKWNYRTSPDGKAADWWETYENQCSVYNTASTDGANIGAGAGGSKTFAVINGYSDANNHYSASFNFSNRKEYMVEFLSYCPTSYVYGIVTNGNPFGNEPGHGLKDVRGWVKLIATGYNAAGQVVGTVEKYLCDYRTANNQVELPTTWQTWDLSGLGKVNKVEFNFTGSDTGTWGLNTPAFLAIDDITIRMN